MGIANYDQALAGLQAILDTYNKESEIYKRAEALMNELIADNIPF